MVSVVVVLVPVLMLVGVGVGGVFLGEVKARPIGTYSSSLGNPSPSPASLNTPAEIGGYLLSLLNNNYVVFAP